MKGVAVEAGPTIVLDQHHSQDFWKFLFGQTISSLGSSFTSFALPLLVFRLTGSAIDVGLAFAVSMLPYLFFGLIIGAWADRTSRKQLMIIADIIRALVIVLLPVLDAMGFLSVPWIYAVLFVNSTMSICFDAASFAAIPSLVGSSDLVTANGRLQASYSLASVIGPSLAGLLLTVIPLPTLLLCDALSFLISAGSLATIRTNFNLAEKQEATSIRQDIVEGLRYVLTHPVLRWLLYLSILANLVVPTIYAQFVVFAKQGLGVSDTQLGMLYAAGSAGVVVVSLAAGRLSKYWSFSTVALGALMLQGLLTIILAINHWYWAALPLWALNWGMSTLYNINAGSLGQAIIPNHLLGRVTSFFRVLAWSTIPLAVFLSGLAIEQAQRVDLIYAGFGIVAFLIPFTFIFTPLGRANRYLAQELSDHANA
jgi:predicted MFS family arabinose efflux permease